MPLLRRTAPLLIFLVAGVLYAQTPNPAQRRQIQEELRSLKQRLAAHYTGDLPPDQIQQRIDQLQRQLVQLGPAPAFTPRPSVPHPAPTTPPPCVPVNPNATPEARALLQEICDVSGKAILTGQHNYPNERNLDTEAIHTVTGKYPAIWGSDFGFTSGEDQDAITHRDLMIQEAKRQAAAGSIIYLCWHMMPETCHDDARALGTGASQPPVPCVRSAPQNLIAPPPAPYA